MRPCLHLSRRRALSDVPRLPAAGARSSGTRARISPSPTSSPLDAAVARIVLFAGDRRDLGRRAAGEAAARGARERAVSPRRWSGRREPASGRAPRRCSCASGSRKRWPRSSGSQRARPQPLRPAVVRDHRRPRLRQDDRAPQFRARRSRWSSASGKGRCAASAARATATGGSPTKRSSSTRPAATRRRTRTRRPTARHGRSSSRCCSSTGRGARSTASSSRSARTDLMVQGAGRTRGARRGRAPPAERAERAAAHPAARLRDGDQVRPGRRLRRVLRRSHAGGPRAGLGRHVPLRPDAQGRGRGHLPGGVRPADGAAERPGLRADRRGPRRPAAHQGLRLPAADGRAARRAHAVRRRRLRVDAARPARFCCAASTSPAARRRARRSTGCSAPSAGATASRPTRCRRPRAGARRTSSSRMLKDVLIAESGLAGVNRVSRCGRRRCSWAPTRRWRSSTVVGLIAVVAQLQPQPHLHRRNRARGGEDPRGPARRPRRPRGEPAAAAQCHPRGGHRRRPAPGRHAVVDALGLVPRERDRQRGARRLRARTRRHPAAPHGGPHRGAPGPVRVGAREAVRVPEGVPDARPAEPDGQEAPAVRGGARVACGRRRRSRGRRHAGEALRESRRLRRHPAPDRVERPDRRAGAELDPAGLDRGDHLRPPEANPPGGRREGGAPRSTGGRRRRAGDAAAERRQSRRAGVGPVRAVRLQGGHGAGDRRDSRSSSRRTTGSGARRRDTSA